MRRDHAAQVKQLRGLVKQARNQLVTLARTLEAGFSAETAWPHRRNKA